MKKEQYSFSSATVECVLEALRNHWFSGDYGDDSNDDIIGATDALEKEVEEQEKETK